MIASRLTQVAQAAVLSITLALASLGVWVRRSAGVASVTSAMLLSGVGLAAAAAPPASPAPPSPGAGLKKMFTPDCAGTTDLSTAMVGLVSHYWGWLLLFYGVFVVVGGMLLPLLGIFNRDVAGLLKSIGLALVVGIFLEPTVIGLVARSNLGTCLV
jgi:hypothetical protein